MRQAAWLHLHTLKHAVHTNTHDVHVLTDGVSETQLRRRPAANSWSVAECLEHLIATGEAYYPRVQHAIKHGPAVPAAHTYQPRVFGRWFIQLAGPTSRWRLRARAPFQPQPVQSDTIRRFVTQQSALLTLLERAHQTDLNRACVPSPLSRWLTLTLGECLDMLVVHQQRHIRQARRARDIILG